MLHAQNMSGLKTLGFSLMMAGLASGVQADGGLLRHVSECVGRMSAQMEHQWMFPDDSSDEVERQRAHLIDILDALITPETATKVLAGRIDAKMAHASLLTRAVFSDDPKTGRWAKAQAERNIRLCGDILLPPPMPEVVDTSAATTGTMARETMNQHAVHRR